jgi:hypothetical protein
MRIPALVLVALVLVALGGCAGPRTGRATGSPSGSASPVPASPSAGPSASAAPSAPAEPTGGASRPTGDTLVTYAKQGGFAGVDDQLRIHPDGRYELTRRGSATGSGTLSAAELNQLRGVFDSSHFTDIPVKSTSNEVADGFTYKIGYGSYAVLAQDGAVPPALQPVIAALEAIVARG